ncbi:MAG TPA: isocitrate lyase/phosphoenolpyruvate mutase family protein [Dongiaceae bacterium]
MKSRRARFREVLSGDRCVHPGSVYDPLSARAAAEIGFEVAMFAGSIASLTVLGDPDLTLLSLTEFAEQARRICRAADIPLLVDADHGYGNALNVMRTVEELETAGIAALTIEDTALPLPYGVAGKAGVISLEEGVGKMRAALAARKDLELTVIGRTSAITLTGLSDTIARAKAYAAAGVDAIFLSGVKQRAELDAVADAIRIPILLGAIVPEVRDPEYLRSRNVKIALLGHKPFFAGVAAVYEALKSQRGAAVEAQAPKATPEDLGQRLSRADQFSRWTKDFL